MELIFPLLEHKQAVLEYWEEHAQAGEMNGGGGFGRDGLYEGWLSNIQDELTRDDGVIVPGVTYLGMESGILVGMINIRYKLNDSLLRMGGHIGYGVRPAERRKGYATGMLRLALDKCRELGIRNVLITCNKTNIGSVRTIINNGGRLEDEIDRDGGGITQRYWIAL